MSADIYPKYQLPSGNWTTDKEHADRLWAKHEAKQATPTVWVSVSSHRARGRLTSITSDPGPSYGIWPEGGWPRGEYFEVAAKHVDALGKVKGLRVLQGKPTGGRLFQRWTS